jgi:MoxR-like ATPase
MGFQGVGKNRVVDFLLNQLQCEREYLQLHRDTTVQSMLSSPSVEGGRLIFKDSPLVRAAINGRILVIDEADKAPVEVVALLKGLIEDGELALPDGRVLYYDESRVVPGQLSITIHPGFRIWALANPAGYPFHGNNLAKEMADVFSCHTVPPLDPESQKNILKSYGPNLSGKTIEKIIRIWQDLSKAHKRGVLAYPFSVREAVSVVRHLAEYPDDGLDDAIENVIAFDRFDSALMKQLDSIFKQHGVQLPVTKTALGGGGREGGISTPRTRASSPKHGKVDPSNAPHVGGNTWAGM